MKRLWVVLGLSLVVAALCVMGNIVLFGGGTRLKNDIEQAIALAEKGDMIGAAEAAQKAEKGFIEYEHTLGLFMNKKTVNEVGESLSKLTWLAKNDDRGEFLSECSRAIVVITHILNHEKLSLYNFF